MKNSDNVNNNSNNFSSKLADLIKENISINPEHYEIYNVKRGLRNSDGTGVLVGLTVIGEVHSYTDENEKVDIPGKLWYRGIDIEDIVSGCVKETDWALKKYFLILFGILPSKQMLSQFSEYLNGHRNLPNNFVEDVILKARVRIL